MKKRAASVRYSDAIADEIIERVSSGETLRSVCRSEGMPSWSAVYMWLDDSADFDARFARARERGHDAIAAEALAIADTPMEGVETVEKDDGKLETRRGDMLGHRKLQVDTRLKLLAKWDRRYGDRVIADVNIKKSASDMTDDELMEIAAGRVKP